tara:strand:- start:242 stop:580 length:339 start_codon:yes stop_codon:yes gene_type:complete
MMLGDGRMTLVWGAERIIICCPLAKFMAMGDAMTDSDITAVSCSTVLLVSAGTDLLICEGLQAVNPKLATTLINSAFLVKFLPMGLVLFSITAGVSIFDKWSDDMADIPYCK